MIRPCLRPFALSAAALALLASTRGSADDSAPKNRVFKTPAGADWVVSIKPARRTAQAEPQSVAVPAPVDVPTVAQQPTLAEPTPADPVPAADLPPVPEIKAVKKGSGAMEAHGVTVVPEVTPHLEVFGRRYVDAYRSVPFNRAEYDANPSYRHEAAMELLFGQLRPTTVVKQAPAPKADEPEYTPYKPFLPGYWDYSTYRTLTRPPFFGDVVPPAGYMWPMF